MAERNTRIRASQIINVKPNDLDSTNVLGAGLDNYVASYDHATGKFTWVASGGGASGESTEKDINQAGHGLSVGDAVKYASGSYSKAKADTAGNAEVVGIVSEVADVDNFTLHTGGYIDGLSGLTAGTVYFLSDSTAGELSSSEPTTEGAISKPVLIAVSTTEGYFYNFRGAQVEGIGGTATYSTSFVDGDLSSAGVLTVTHNLSFDYPIIAVFDNNDDLVQADDVTYVDSNTVTVDLASFTPLTGTWNVRIVGGAWRNSIIQDDDGDTSVDTEKTDDEDKIRFKIAGTEQLLIQDGAILPITTNDIDLGSNTYKFKDLYVAGTIYGGSPVNFGVDGITINAGQTIDEFSTDGTLTGDSDTALPTEKAVKSYVDNEISGIGGGGWELVHSQTLSSEVSNFTVSSLDGDTAKYYKIILKVVPAGSGTMQITMRPNSDSSSNYYRSGVHNASGSVSSNYTASAETEMWLGEMEAGRNMAFIEAVFYADTTGKHRPCISKFMDSGNIAFAGIWMSSWTNTGSNITSLQFVRLTGGNFASGTYIEIWKLVS